MLKAFFTISFFSIYMAPSFAGDCPDGAILVSYVSPVSKNRKAVCMKQVNGQNIQHGPDMELDANGNVIKEKYYVNGVESKKPEASAAQAPTKTENTQYTKAIAHLLKILSRQQVNDSITFSVDKCDNNPVEWIKMAIMKTSKDFTYKFKEKCDVDGTFKANLGELFPISLNLRNLMEFNYTAMNVIQTATPGGRGILYNFKAPAGTLSSPTIKIEFEAWYEVELNPMNGHPFNDTQKGKIKITKINDQVTQIEENLHY